MKNKRILTVQDISCVGQCSLTVALPILSACGIETAILPSAVLSTHTAGFTGYTVRDLSGDMPAIAAHWKKEGIAFDGIYTGYLGSREQVDYVLALFENHLLPGGVKIVDPAMGDGGKLYPAFDRDYVAAMKRLVAASDVTLPNITEAAFLTGMEYREEYDEGYVRALCEALCQMGAGSVVLTGVGYEAGKTGVAVYEQGELRYYCHARIPKGSHGTGDIYASAFVGAWLRGKDKLTAAAIAADYTVDCILATQDDPEHWYGVKFEPLLGKLMERVRS